MAIELIEKTLKYDKPKFFKQRVINEIVENNIGTYSSKKKPDLIQLTKKTMDDKISECFMKDSLTIKILDLLEISKGYRYSVIFEYEELNKDSIKNKCININSDYYKEIGNSIDETTYLYLEDDEHIFIKFHRNISILDKSDMPQWHSVRDPILVVFHKNINIFEIRFDRINTELEKSYYNAAIKSCLSWLGNNIGIEYSYINLDEIIRYIDEHYPDVVTELIWAGELAKSQGITLKAGEDMIMPFFGTLKVKIQEWRKTYAEKVEALECLDELESYLDKTKKYANEQFRTLRWIKYEENGKYFTLKEPIDLKITFNYSGTMLDLINIYDNELNDMERIDYVTKFIGKIRAIIKKS